MKKEQAGGGGGGVGGGNSLSFIISHTQLEIEKSTSRRPFAPLTPLNIEKRKGGDVQNIQVREGM